MAQSRRKKLIWKPLSTNGGVWEEKIVRVGNYLPDVQYEQTYASSLPVQAETEWLNVTESTRFLDEAKRNGFADAHIYGRAMEALAKSEAPAVLLIMRLFNEADTAGLTSPDFYNNTLEALAKSKQQRTEKVSLARRLLDEAKEGGFAHIAMYNNTIKIIAKSKRPNPNPERAWSLLQEAKTAGIADALTYKNTLDVLALSKWPKEEWAMSLLEEARKKNYLSFPLISSGTVVDLQGHSFGTAYFFLKKQFLELLRTSKEEIPLTLICGKGNNRIDQEADELQQALSAVIRSFGNQIAYDEQNEQDSLTIHITLRPMNLNNEDQEQKLSADQQNNQGLRFFVPARIQENSKERTNVDLANQKKKLNPFAKDFVPSLKK